MSFNLATILTEATLAAPDAPVSRFGGNSTSYRELDEQSGRLAAGLPAAGLAPRRGVAGAPGDTAVLVYTSGTTGRPKGAELTHFQLYMNSTIAGGLFGVRSDDVVLAVLPFFHVFGLSSVINVFVRFGGCLSIRPRFKPAAALDVTEADRCTAIGGGPAPRRPPAPQYSHRPHPAARGRPAAARPAAPGGLKRTLPGTVRLDGR